MVAEHRAEEGRAAADQADSAEPLPRGRHRAQRADDAEALGRVVEREADDSTVARLTAPAWAETPMARPSAKLCRPMATAMMTPVRSARRPAASRPRRDWPPPRRSAPPRSSRRPSAAARPRAAGAARGCPARRCRARSRRSGARSARHVTEALAVLEPVERLLDDLVGVREHVDEDEGQDSHSEHRERHAGRGDSICSRPTGSPMKIVNPASAPSRTVWRSSRCLPNGVRGT